MRKTAFFSVLVSGQTFSDKKGICGNAQGRVVMEAAPVSPLEVVQAELLFEFLIITLDAPATLDGVDQCLAGDVRRQRRELKKGKR